MEFKIGQGKLLKELSLIAPIIPTTGTTPVTESIVLEVTEGQLVIKSMNNVISYITTIDAEVKAPGAIIVDFKKLARIVKGMPSKDLIFRLKNEVLKIICGKIKFEIAIVVSVTEYPKMIKPKDTVDVVMDSSKLYDYAERTSFAVSSDELRVSLTGVLFLVDKESFKMVATDGISLVELTDGNISGAGEEKKVILQGRSLKTLGAIMSHNEGDVRIFFDKNYTQFVFDGGMVFIRNINGDFPSYQAIMPQNNENIFNINTKALISTLNRISITVNPLTKLVKLNLEEGKLKIMADDSTTTSKSEEILDIEYTGEDLLLASNITKFVELLRSFHSEEVEISIGNPMKPIKIVPISANDFNVVTVLMPVTVQ